MGTKKATRLLGLAVLLFTILFDVGLSKPKHKVLVASFDGFAAHYLKWGQRPFPTFTRLMQQGVFTESIQSVFPSETFPNHFAIATGLHPESHGIVSNVFFDPALNRSFTSKKYGEKTRQDLLDPVFWIGEPMWVTARRLGVAKTATSMWPGELVSFTEKRLKASLHRTDFSKKVTFEERVDQTVGWLVEDDVDVAYLYNFEPDDTGHDFGTTGLKMDAVLKQADRDLDHLIKVLEKNGFTGDNFNLVVCSDHGMWNIDKEIYLEDYMNVSALFEQVTRFGAHASLWPRAGFEQEAYNQLNRVANLPNIKGYVDVFKKSEVPERLHYSQNGRIPPLMVVGRPGVYIAHTREFSAAATSYVANHGTDPEDFRMRPIFIARGPAFPRNFNATQLTKSMQTKDVYAVVAALIGLGERGPAVNASFANVAGLFRDDFAKDVASTMAKRDSAVSSSSSAPTTLIVANNSTSLMMTQFLFTLLLLAFRFI